MRCERGEVWGGMALGFCRRLEWGSGDPRMGFHPAVWPSDQIRLFEGPHSLARQDVRPVVSGVFAMSFDMYELDIFYIRVWHVLV